MTTGLPDCCGLTYWTKPSFFNVTCGAAFAEDLWMSGSRKSSQKAIKKSLPRAQRVSLKKTKLNQMGFEVIRGVSLLDHVIQEHAMFRGDNDDQVAKFMKVANTILFDNEFVTYSPFPEVSVDLIAATLEDSPSEFLIRNLSNLQEFKNEWLVIGALRKALNAAILGNPSLIDPLTRDCLVIFGSHGLGLISNHECIAENVCLALPNLLIIESVIQGLARKPESPLWIFRPESVLEF
mgnify:CR=1 FL=1|tara:strand:+ start:1586 stop:2296 length:711 start_codon:yes stop_codon:yes gene_type:complete